MNLKTKQKTLEKRDLTFCNRKKRSSVIGFPGDVFLRQQDLLTGYMQTILLHSACSLIKKTIWGKDYGYWVILFLQNEFTQSIGRTLPHKFTEYTQSVTLRIHDNVYLRKTASLCKFCGMAGVIQALISGQIRKKKLWKSFASVSKTLALKMLRFSFENASWWKNLRNIYYLVESGISNIV